MRRLALAVVAVLLAGCSYDATTIPEPEAEPSSPPTSAAPARVCDDVTSSYTPDGTIAQLGDRGQVEAIRSRGRLVAGVSADTFKMASRDPLSGDLVGFDIDMVNAVARAIFPDARDLEKVITFRVITAADRLPALIDDRVDIVVRNMTINCARWDEIAFSAVYNESGQKLLVRQDLAERDNPVDTVAELGDLRVCAPLGTTSLANIEDLAPDDTEIVTAVNHTQCLVKFQRGEADAITGDDTVLAGLAAQDPYAVVPSGQEKFSAEPYGIGVNESDVDLVRFVNAVLEESRANGSWQDSYDTWLRPTLGQGTQPRPTYGRRFP
jgi:polar amino acid transport system substrate-binding protein